VAAIGSELYLEDLEAHKMSKRPDAMYGVAWGDPSRDPKLWQFINRFIQPFVRSDKVACEIGSGGGRITQYLTGFQKIYAVDYFAEMHEEMRKHLDHEYIHEVLTSGTDFPGMSLVDYTVSFDTFIYFEPATFRDYLQRLSFYLRPEAEVIIQYASKFKEASRPGLVGYAPSSARTLVQQAGYFIREEENKLLPESNILRLNYKG